MDSGEMVKACLRELNYPLSVEKALDLVWIIYNGNTAILRRRIEEPLLSFDLISEFIFGETDEEGEPTKLSEIRHLETSAILCEYLNSKKDKPSFNRFQGDFELNAMVMALFPEFGAPPERTKMLVDLVTLAISTKSYLVLRSVGVQMQQCGPLSTNSLQLANGLVNRFLKYESVCIHSASLLSLPSHAPVFVANLMNSVSEMYFNPNHTETIEYMEFAPRSVLVIFVRWIYKNQKFLFTPHYYKCSPFRSPTIEEKKEAKALPFMGLFRWCIYAPLCVRDSKQLELYSDLHFMLMKRIASGWKSYSEQDLAANDINRRRLMKHPLFKHLGITHLKLKKPCTLSFYSILSSHLITSLTDPISNKAAVRIILRRLVEGIAVSIHSDSMLDEETEMIKLIQPLKYHLMDCAKFDDAVKEFLECVTIFDEFW